MVKNYSSVFAGAVLIMLVGCQVISGERSMQKYSTDGSITASVKTALAESNKISARYVHVETDNGTVLLSGFVTTFKEKSEAAYIAAHVNGVKVVHNKLVIKPLENKIY